MNTTIYNARDVLECFFFQFDFGLKNALKKRSGVNIVHAYHTDDDNKRGPQQQHQLNNTLN